MEEEVIDALKVEKLKVWYSLFAVILDDPQYSDSEKINKLSQMRELLDLEVSKPS